MIFIDPSLEEVYQTLVNNDEIINFLKQENLILTKESLAKDNPREKVQEMTQYIYANNSSMLYQVSQVLLTYKEKIKSMSIRELLDELIAWKEIALALGISPAELTRNIYVNIIYTYKYCYASSFFQNNKDRFIPENDFYEMEKNPAAMAFYDAMMKEFDKLDYILSKTPQFLEYDKIPWDLMTYLTQMLGLEKSTFDLEDDDENKFREIAKNILDIYRIKGTNYSFELFFNFLGYNIKIHEYYFDRRLFYSNAAGNSETDSDNAMNYEYYLTTLNPAENKLEDLSINEIVLPSDISPQYSLDEFNDLIKEYGAEAVLGYSPIYKTKKEDGTEIYKEYKGNVYKYFKTNYIYYEINLSNGNISPRQYKTITKCLDFLTPSYVMKKDVVSKAKAGETDDAIGFDGDGTKKPDVNGNYGKIEILDSEDWSSSFKNHYITVDEKTGALLKQTDPGIFEEYHNSLYNPDDTTSEAANESSKFRLPLKFRAVNKSINRYLTGAIKTPYVTGHRVKYFVDGNVIYPYYTTPPYTGTGTSNLKGSSVVYSNPDNLEEVSLTGKGNTVKEQIRISNTLRPVRYLCKNLNEIESTINKLEPFATCCRTISYVCEYSYNAKNKSTLYKNLQNSYNFCNYTDDVENIDSSDKISDSKNYYKNTEIYSKFIYGRYVIGDSGVSFKIYRFGNYKMPIAGTDSYSYDYKNYIDSFGYKPLIENNNLKRKLSLNTKKLIINMDNLEKIEEDIESKWAETRSKDLPLDYVTSNIYFDLKTKRYYKPVKTTFFRSFFIKDKEQKGKIFPSLNEAKKYYEKHPEEVIRNNEYFIFDEGCSANNGLGYGTLYCFEYANKNIGDLIYATDEGKLYKINDNYKLEEVKDFFGKLELYKDDVLLDSVPENLEGVSAKINLYDKDWFGYDEQADSEDFLFYNSSHTIKWEGVIDDPIEIGRPIKYVTDKEYYNNNLLYKLIKEKLPKTYTYFGSSKLSDYNEDYILVKDLIVSPKEYNLYTKNGESFIPSKEESMIEGIDYYTKSSKGIINCIESNIENITEIFDGGVDYYTSMESFLFDYYKIIINNDFSLDNFSNRFKEEFIPGPNGYSESQIAKIKKYYNNAIIQIYSLSNSFIDKLLEKRNDIKIGLDDYGFNMDIFSEFRDTIKCFADFLITNENEVDDYFNSYYYRTLVELYRERFILDDNDLGAEINDNKPMFAPLNNLEKFDSKSGKLLFPTTLLSSSKIYDNGMKDALRIPFDSISLDSEKNKIFLKVDHNEIVKILDKDPNFYYKFLSLKNFQEGTEEYEKVKKGLDERYSDYLNCLKPTFQYKDRSFYNNKKETTLWQKNKSALESNYFSYMFRTYDGEGFPIFKDNGEVINKNGGVITDPVEINNRIKSGYENGYSKIEIIHNINNLNIDSDEIKNIEGYITIKEFNQNLLDNRISFPVSDDWVKRDYYGNAIEYSSFGDDRDFQYYKVFRYRDTNPKRCKCRAFINENGKVVLKFKENKDKGQLWEKECPNYIDNNLDINTIQITKLK